MYLYGASGHAKVVKDALESQGVKVTGVVDDNPQLDSFEGMPVLHSAEGLSPIIVSVGTCAARRNIVGRLGDVFFGTAIHRSAIVSPSATVGDGSVVMAGAILQPCVSIGRHSIVNTGASVDHDCIVGDFVHIAPHCTLCGSVSVGEGTWVGAGTTIIQGVKIGRNCFIGAGSLVLKDIPDGCVAFGSPCRIRKDSSYEEYNLLVSGAYVGQGAGVYPGGV